VQHSTFLHCWQWHVAQQYTCNVLISLHCNSSYMKHATLLRYMHTLSLVSVFQAVSKPQFLRTLLYSLIHSLCGPAHGIQTKDTDWLYTIRCACIANDKVRLWSYSTGTCAGLRNTKFVVIYHTTLVSPTTHLINTKKKKTL